VIYKGLEGEGTYAFGENDLGNWAQGLALFANGSVNSAKGHYNPLDPNSPSYQVQQSPFWTAAAGFIYKANGWKISLIDKLVGQQYEDTPAKRVDVNGSTPVVLAKGAASYLGSFYKLGAYNNMDLTAYYDLGDPGVGADFEIGGGIYNLLGSKNIVAITINDKAPFAGQGSAQNIFARPGSLDQYYFQPDRSFQVTIKARL
jgi:iron complex outermembrane recepter protein